MEKKSGYRTNPDLKLSNFELDYDKEIPLKKTDARTILKVKFINNILNNKYNSVKLKYVQIRRFISKSYLLLIHNGKSKSNAEYIKISHFNLEPISHTSIRPAFSLRGYKRSR